MSDTKRKPHLTKKVLRGLRAIAAAVEAGDLMDGDLRDSKDDASRALEWIWSRTEPLND